MEYRVCEYFCVYEQGFFKDKRGAGNFHNWGTVLAGDLRNTITVGIVENLDGTVVLVPPDCIIFRDKPQED